MFGLGWLTPLAEGLAKVAAWGFAWWNDRQQQKHDAEVRTNQQTVDALHGENEAIKQVDRVGSALDTGGVRIADDPDNINR
jgi:hypothetical protein